MNTSPLQELISFDNVIYADFPSKSRKLLTEQDIYNKCYDRWINIRRAGDDSKTIATEAILYIASFEFLFLQTPNEIIFDCDLLKNKSRHQTKQRGRFLKQLADIYEIKYHSKYTHGGRIMRCVFSAKRTENSLKILENPTLFYESASVKNGLITGQKRLGYRSNLTSPIYREYIDNKENRSSANARSNFVESIVFRKKECNIIQDNNSKTLRDFYPLSQSDCLFLQSLSGREFSLRAMNEILLDMSQRLKDRVFSSKRRFLNYMGAVFTFEKRDAVKVSNETFRIKKNKNILDDDIQNQIKLDEEIIVHEKYLTELESRNEVNPEMHLKKKLACVLERSKAYKLLTSYKFGRRVGDIFEIHLDRSLELSEFDKKLILAQVKATQEFSDFANGKMELISEIKIIAEESIESVLKKQLSKKPFEAISSKEVANKLREEGGIWSITRASLIEYLNDHKDSGKWIDKNWFSKLEVLVDEDKKTVKLTAPNSFIKSWITRNYKYLISGFCNDKGYQLELN